MNPFGRNMALGAGAASSLAFHIWIAAGIQALPKGDGRRPTSVTMVNAKPKPKKEEDKKEEKKEPPKPIETPPKIATAPKPAPAPPDPTPAPAPAPGPAGPGGPDFGISMTGGGGGLAVPTGPGGGGGGDGPGPSPSMSATVPKEKVLGGGGGDKPPPGPDECTEPEVKAKLLGSITPQYTDDARSAEVEGVVQLKLTVDPSGAVSAVAVLKGLGHGLDQSASASAKGAKFQPATRCGKPSSTTVVINVRYQLGE